MNRELVSLMKTMDSSPAVTRLRQYREADAQDLFDSRVDVSVKDAIKIIGVVKPFMTESQKRELMDAIDKDFGLRMYFEGVNSSTTQPRQSRQTTEVAVAEGEPLFPYASDTIFARVKTLIKDVEFIRSKVLTEDGNLYVDVDGNPLASVRDLTGFVGAVNTMYTTVGNLEPIDKIRKDINSLTQAITEAVSALPVEHRGTFLDSFKETLSRINKG